MKNKKQRRTAEATINNPNEEIYPTDRSPIIPQRTKLKSNLRIYRRELNEKQKQFLELVLNKESKLIFVSGPAGTSKTFLAVFAALQMINAKKVSDIIYVRSAVESSDAKLGFLPGEADEKMAPYIQPLLDKLIEFLSKGDIDLLKKEERISAIPVGFLRGLSLNAKVVITDEAQNMTYKELFTLITRTGEFSKVFILGDPDQSDINGKSGFIKMISHFDDEESRQNGIHVFRFTEDDIVRSGLVQFIIKKAKKLL
jgi:phosphate starvation-inducible protein PhoH and related proteins